MIQARNIDLNTMPYVSLNAQCVTGGYMSLEAPATGEYLICGYHNLNTESLQTIDLYVGDTQIGAIAVSDVGQYHWRATTFIQVAHVTEGQTVQMRKGGTCVTAAASGRSALSLIRIG